MQPFSRSNVLHHCSLVYSGSVLLHGGASCLLRNDTARALGVFLYYKFQVMVPTVDGNSLYVDFRSQQERISTYHSAAFKTDGKFCEFATFYEHSPCFQPVPSTRVFAK